MSAQLRFVDLRTQYLELQQTIKANIDGVLEHGQFVMGPEVFELEERLAAYVGVEHCVSVSSGTDALIIALMALGIKAGDEVITSPFSFFATAEAIANLGAIPVFVDVDPETYNLEPNLIEAAITPRCRAIMPVSLFGQCAEMDSINTIAERFNIPVVEDAAQSMGATYNQRKSGALSMVGCTSFFPSKPLGCYGDGGACFTDDDSLATAMRESRAHGEDRRYHHKSIGLNGRLDTIQAAVLLAKLEIFEGEVVAREHLGARYSELLSDVEGITAPYIAPENRSVYAQYTIQVANRAHVVERLNAVGVPTAIHYPVTIPEQPAFDYLGISRGTFPVSESLADQVLSLPMHPYLEASSQQMVVAALTEIITTP